MTGEGRVVCEWERRRKCYTNISTVSASMALGHDSMPKHIPMLSPLLSAAVCDTGYASHFC